MTSKEMGDILFNLRIQQNIPAKKLFSGICSHSSLFRFESGETPIDYLTLKYLLSRLGKSINKVENMLKNDDFEFLMLNSLIEEALLSGNLESAKSLLEENMSLKDFSGPVYRQYFERMYCVLLQKNGTPSKIIIPRIISALNITIPNFSIKKLSDYLLAEDEWILLFMLLEHILKSGDKNSSEKISLVYRLFTTLSFDRETRILLFPKISWLYLQVCDSLDEKIEVCENVLSSLLDNTRLFHLDVFLRAKCTLFKEKYGADHQNYIHLKEQYDALLWLYKDAGQKISIEPEIWFSINNPEIYLLPETIRYERDFHKISQEQAGDKLGIDQKTFSRIETGTSHPKPSTLSRIKEALGMYRGIHNTLLVVNNFELLELESKISQFLSAFDYSKAQTLLNELKPHLSLSHRENAQYIQYTQASLDYKLGKISPDEALKRCIKAFEITRPYVEDSFDQVVLSRKECMIAHFISLIYKDCGDILHATSLLEKVVIGLSKSRINPRYHYRELTILLLTLSYNFEIMGCFEKSTYYCNQGLFLQFDFQRSNMIPLYCIQKYYILERQNLSIFDVQDAYKNIYTIRPLLTKVKSPSLENHFRKRFGREIFD